MADDFLHRHVPAVGKSVHRMGLALNFGLAADDLSYALDQGIQWIYWTAMRTSHHVPVLREALRTRRDQLVIQSGASGAYFGWQVRRAAESALKKLKIDAFDVFYLGWVGVGAAYSEATVEELVKLKERGLTKAIGVSIHDRPRAAKLVLDSPLDLFMLRYNAAHPGLERDIAPAFDTRRPAVLAYTATSWRSLLGRPRGWTGPLMTAADCYRFCLSSPHVDVVLSGPGSRAELDANLAGALKGPLSPEENSWMRDFGRAVHG